MSILGYNCANIPVFNCESCPTSEAGKIRHLILVQDDCIPADPTDFNLWKNLVDAKLAWVVPNVTGELAEPSPNELPGFGDKAFEIQGWDFEATIGARWIAAQRAFWNDIQQRDDIVMFMVTENEMFRSSNPVSIDPKLVIPPEETNIVMVNVTAKWRQSKAEGAVLENFSKTATIFQGCNIYA